MIRTKFIGLMTVFIIIVLSSLSFAGEVNLPKTGQTTCYDDSGNVIDCYGTGQDGEIQAGVEWPSPRFVDNGDGTITDNLTGLMWLKDANCFGYGTWQGALDGVANFNTSPGSYGCTGYTANYTDWVLPNIVELESLVNAEQSNSAAWLTTQSFINVQSSGYWSSSTCVNDLYLVWGVSMLGGRVGYNDKSSNHHSWPVRGGQTGPAKTWQTGQTTGYATNDDGDLQRGDSWPSPRFADNGDGTITDYLTGLIWLKDANCGESMNWNDALTFCNNLTSGSCQLTDGSVAGDWHLPNRKELFSLVDYSRYIPPLPQGHLFDNVQLSSYWSASTRAYDANGAWGVGMASGSMGYYTKSAHFYMLPVRGDENSVPFCKGDFEPDGDVDGSDLAVFAADFGRTDCGAGSPSCEGDFEPDGDADGIDLVLFAADFGRQDCPAP